MNYGLAQILKVLIQIENNVQFQTKNVIQVPRSLRPDANLSFSGQVAKNTKTVLLTYSCERRVLSLEFVHTSVYRRVGRTVLCTSDVHTMLQQRIEQSEKLFRKKNNKTPCILQHVLQRFTL